MNDFEIEILPSDEGNKGTVQLPLNFLTIGEVENDDVKVYIKQGVYKALEEYGCSDINHELGTIILGDYVEELGKMYVVISDYIIAKYTDASASTLTFTHETWDYVHKEHETKHQNTKIIGWQHTHPGYGIFLSNYDMFIQENFFNMPFQVAYVIDPIQHLRGFFQWKNGCVEKLKGFYIYDDIGKNIKIDVPKFEKTVQKNSVEKLELVSNIQRGIQLGLIAAVVVLAVATGSLSKKYVKQVDKQKELENEIAYQNQLISEQANEIASIQKALDTNTETTIENEKTKIAAAGNKIENADVESDLTEHESSIEDIGLKADKMFLKPYVVKSGDSLISICNEHNLDYSSFYKIILSINAIQNPNKIDVGQTLLLPIWD